MLVIKLASTSFMRVSRKAWSYLSCCFMLLLRQDSSWRFFLRVASTSGKNYSLVELFSKTFA